MYRLKEGKKNSATGLPLRRLEGKKASLPLMKRKKGGHNHSAKGKRGGVRTGPVV